MPAVYNEYKDLINNIKDNFDLNKIGLPNNIYSGREFKSGDNLNNYIPNLPEIFDNENAAYGSLLNGYSQLKGYCVENGITLDEFLDDPVKAYFRGAQSKIDELDEKARMPLDEPLGKRMARTLIQPKNMYDIVNRIGLGYRSLEFLTQAQDRDNNVYDNIIISSLAGELTHTLNHSSDNLFDFYFEDTDNLKKMFAFGANVDNLLKVSNNYRNLVGENVKYDYDNHMLLMANVDPVRECNKGLYD